MPQECPGNTPGMSRTCPGNAPATGCPEHAPGMPRECPRNAPVTGYGAAGIHRECPGGPGMPQECTGMHRNAGMHPGKAPGVPKSRARCPDLFPGMHRKCPKNALVTGHGALGIPRECPGHHEPDALKMPQECPGNARERPTECPGNAPLTGQMPRQWPRNASGISKAAPGMPWSRARGANNAPRVQWNAPGMPRPCPQKCHRNALGIHQECSGTRAPSRTKLPQYCPGIPLECA